MMRRTNIPMSIKMTLMTLGWSWSWVDLFEVRFWEAPVILML